MSAPIKERKGRVPNVPRPEPWKPPEWTPEDAHAVQAVAQGRASEDQQRRAIRFIVDSICGTYDMPYRPGGAEGARDTDFALGRMFAGQQIVKFINLNIAAVRGKNTEQGAAPKEQAA